MTYAGTKAAFFITSGTAALAALLLAAWGMHNRTRPGAT
jgi:dTDP-4-amino-4,6-dideoxygalactose transaminase